MSKIFIRTFRVRWGELDPSGFVSPANYLRYLMETAWDWGVAIGWGADYSENPDILWLIRDTGIRFIQPLRHNDEFDLSIWMVHWQRVQGTRCFELTRKDNGQVIAQGTQQVVCIDANSGRPTNPPNDIESLRLEDPRVFPFERFPKVAPAEGSFVMQRQVEWTDLDAYEHVNNAVYASYAEEAAVQAFSASGWSPAKLAEANLSIATRSLQIQYLSVAEWNETLNISTHPLNVKETGGSRYVGMTRLDGTPVAECIIDWELVDRKTGEARALPEGALRDDSHPND